MRTEVMLVVQFLLLFFMYSKLEAFFQPAFLLSTPSRAQLTSHLSEKQRPSGMHSYLSTYKHLHLCYFLMVHFHIHLSSSLLDFQVLTNSLALFPSEDAYSGFSHFKIAERTQYQICPCLLIFIFALTFRTKYFKRVVYFFHFPFDSFARRNLPTDPSLCQNCTKIVLLKSTTNLMKQVLCTKYQMAVW